ncbi:hypothetical protein B0H13DRAFT_1857292 [Mycena leptocephala]|nr:hypothetical protein B0H13DRAFT_1857292 [Mycena leptocephala]
MHLSTAHPAGTMGGRWDVLESGRTRISFPEVTSPQQEQMEKIQYPAHESPKVLSKSASWWQRQINFDVGGRPSSLDSAADVRSSQEEIAIVLTASGRTFPPIVIRQRHKMWTLAKQIMCDAPGGLIRPGCNLEDTRSLREATTAKEQNSTVSRREAAVIAGLMVQEDRCWPWLRLRERQKAEAKDVSVKKKCVYSGPKVKKLPLWVTDRGRRQRLQPAAKSDKAKKKSAPPKKVARVEKKATTVVKSGYGTRSKTKADQE